jgi:hypothetical protein
MFDLGRWPMARARVPKAFAYRSAYLDRPHPGPPAASEWSPLASLKGLDIPSRRAVFVPWKPSRRRGFGMGNPAFS